MKASRDGSGKRRSQGSGNGSQFKPGSSFSRSLSSSRVPSGYSPNAPTPKFSSVVKVGYIQSAGRTAKGPTGKAGIAASLAYYEKEEGGDRRNEKENFFDSERNDIPREKLANELSLFAGKGKSMYTLMLSPSRHNVDMRSYARTFMEILQERLEREYKWSAIVHTDTQHHHVHFQIGATYPKQKDPLGSSVAEGDRVFFDRDDLRIVREAGIEALYREHGLQREYDLNKQVERDLLPHDEHIPYDLFKDAYWKGRLENERDTKQAEHDQTEHTGTHIHEPRLAEPEELIKVDENPNYFPRPALSNDELEQLGLLTPAQNTDIAKDLNINRDCIEIANDSDYQAIRELNEWATRPGLYEEPGNERTQDAETNTDAEGKDTSPQQDKSQDDRTNDAEESWGTASPGGGGPLISIAGAGGGGGGEQGEPTAVSGIGDRMSLPLADTSSPAPAEHQLVDPVQGTDPVPPKLNPYLDQELVAEENRKREKDDRTARRKMMREQHELESHIRLQESVQKEFRQLPSPKDDRVPKLELSREANHPSERKAGEHSERFKANGNASAKVDKLRQQRGTLSPEQQKDLESKIRDMKDQEDERD